MEHRKQHRTLIAVAAGLLTFGSGCMLTDMNKTGAKKPDVTQPGVLPPPQEMMKPASTVAPGGVVLAGGTQTQTGASQGSGSGPANMNANASGPSTLSKLMAKTERKVPATEMAVAWRNRIAYLPDPTKNGAMGCGLAGQLFLYGGPKLEFALADGTLTVDLIDETPRPAGQPAATPERWQFDKMTLRKLQTVDETFGKSYVLFLPWPVYKPDITKVRISARYDPENGQTLYATPSVVSIDTSAPFGTPVFDGMSSTTKPAGGMGSINTGPQPFTGLPMGGAPFGGMPMNPIPLGGGSPAGGMPLVGGASGAIPLGAAPATGAGMPLPSGAPMMPLPSGTGMPAGAVPSGTQPMEPLPPLGITIPPR